MQVPSDAKVPSDWIKVNSTKKTIRYHPPEVVNALDELSLANEELSVVCRATWDSFLKAFNGCYSEFQAAVQALAALDCLYSLAVLSRTKVLWFNGCLITVHHPKIISYANVWLFIAELCTPYFCR